MRNWADLPAEEQRVLREAYQAELDRAPRTCTLDEKILRFAAWLAERDVAFSAADLSPRQSG
ncbi:hypothetical protein [Maritimibacter sp. UBA3975]|uniref:hypothetical protein n=1 Tax=Maritimibacter sp. UBA3975 TaxID=1946833 RepID=UPI0025C60CBD|nr:hypothetical protein [Maritimibacter sp. UBA3975]